MNNKKGGFGTKFLLILLLMIASAIGGAYAYRVLDGKMAVREAVKQVESVKVSEYDTEEASEIQTYIDETKSSLETATTRKEVYEIIDDFNDNVDDVMTKTEKELEEAKKAAEEAKNSSSDSSNNNNSSDDNTNDEDNSSDDDSSNSIFNSIFGN